MFSAIANWEDDGGQVLLVTLTAPHKGTDRLATLWDTVSSAWSLTTKGQPWSRQIQRLGSPGSIKTVEVTYGVSGWHPHLHVILLISPSASPEDIEAFRAWLVTRWIDKVKSLCGRAPRPDAQSVTTRLSRATASSPQFTRGTSRTDLSGYVSKSVDSTTNRATDLTSGRGSRDDASPKARSRSHWNLLHLAAGGDRRAQRLWGEFEQASHGRRQTTWSHGLREHLTRLTPTPSGTTGDDEGTEPTPVEDRVRIVGSSWDRLLRPRPARILDLLDAAQAGPIPLRHYLNSHGIEFREALPRRGDPPPPGDLPPVPARHQALLGRWSA